ncbi:MAG: RNA methyltransferase [Crocinitomicaceae bacterium]|nr:RNA methyltransferase [Crocinitomicaceae bacterium]MBK8924903.1 RNA methyltransferase [Crocinitomicaceae bacterium]
MQDKNWLIEQLAKHISEHKFQLFEQVLSYRTRHITVVLENIFQPHNASAVLRSCDCFGIQDVHIIENGNKYETSSGVDMGSSKWLTLNRYNQEANNTVSCIESLKKKGYRIVATTPHTNDCLIHELPIDQPLALMYGTEMSGLSELALQHADAFVRLPMYGFTESFNISVSVALSLFELTERMRKSSFAWQLSTDEKTDLKLEWVRKVLRNSAKVEAEILARKEQGLL